MTPARSNEFQKNNWLCKSYLYSVSARKFYLRAKVAPEDLF